MNPRLPDPKLSNLVEELRRVDAPKELSAQILGEIRALPAEPRRSSRRVLKGLVLSGVGASTMAAILLLSAKPDLAFSQIMDLNRNAFNVISTTTGPGTSETAIVSGNQFSVIRKFEDKSIHMEIEWDFDGKRLFMGSAIRMVDPPTGKVRAAIGFAGNQKYGTLRTANDFRPTEVVGLRKNQGYFDQAASKPTVFPFPTPKKLPEETFDGRLCEVFGGEMKIVSRLSLLQHGKIYVDKETHRILGKALSYHDGEVRITHYSYPAELPASDFLPRPDWKVYDLDMIQRQMAESYAHPRVAKTEHGYRVELVCAAHQANGSLLVLWKGTPPNGTLDHPAAILGNPTRRVYCTSRTPFMKVLKDPLPLPWQQNVGGHLIVAKKPIREFVDLKVPHYVPDRSRPIRRKGKVLGYQSRFNGYATFTHVPVMEVPTNEGLLATD